MRLKTILFTLLCCVIPLSAQEQNGIVKTIGRPDKPGEPIDNVMVRVQGMPVASVSDISGQFCLTLPHYVEGQAYTLSRISKTGYQLADDGMIGRSLPYSSDIPLEVSMISNEEYNRTRMEIAAKVRSRVETEYQNRLGELEKQLEDKTISEEHYRQRFIELLDYYDNAENLIETLADRYARTDYDNLDSLDRHINSLIEQGKLEEAEQMIQSKGTEQALMQIKANNLKLEQTLEEGKRAEAQMTESFARELRMQFDIASMKFDNNAAAGFLKKRMELDTTNLAWAMDYAAFIRDYLGRYDEVMNIYQRLLNGSSDMNTMATLHNCIGNVHQLQGHHDAALESYRLSAELRENESLSSSGLAKNYHNIATIYSSKNMYGDALDYIEKAEALYEEHQDSLGLASTYSLMAYIQVDFGEFGKAEELLIQSLGIKERILGESDLQVANIYSNLAKVMKEEGKYDEAERYAQKTLEIRTKLLGEHHPDVADAYLRIGSIEVETGNNQNALDYYHKALKIYKEFHGDIHPDLAAAYNNLGYFYSNVMNDMQQAKHYYSEAATMLVKIYGEMHSDYAQAIQNLAVIHSSLAEYNNALQLYHDAIEIYTSLYGEDSSKVGDVYNNLALLYYRLGQYDKCRQLFEKVLAIFRISYGESHPNTGLAYHNLGSIYRESNDLIMALDSFLKAADIYKAAYGGETHPRLGTTYDAIGCLYLRKKDYEKAEKYLYKGLIIRENCYGTHHSDVATSYNNFSQLYQELGNYDKAAELLLKSYEIQKNIYNENHPNVATVLSNLATCYMKQNKYETALDYSKQALEILEKHYDNEHPNVILYRYGLAYMYSEAGLFEEALPLMKAVHETSYEKDGASDKHTAHYFSMLHNLYYKIMGDESYDGRYDKEYEELCRTTAIIARVAPGSPAEQRGLSGTYHVASYEDWTLADNDRNFFAYNQSVASRPEKTYVFYRDGEFIKVPFKDRLGISLNPKWISLEEKESIIKSFKKWRKKQK